MSTDVLAGMLTPSPVGVTHDTGVVVAVVDATHVSVDLGDRTVTAFLPATLFGSAPVGAFVMLSLSENTYTVTGATGGAAASLVPIGAIVIWWTNTAPAGWLFCDGSTFSASTYPQLNAVLGGTTLPDLQAVFLVGYKAGDSDFGTMWGTGGARDVTLSTAQIPSHTHNESWANIDGSKYAGSVASGGYYSGDDMSVGTSASGSAGGGGSHENLPPYKVCRYIIRGA